jgi:hypothetical protein
MDGVATGSATLYEEKNAFGKTTQGRNLLP